MRSSSRTSAPRSSVIHADNGMFTVCGTRIGDGWTGQYTEQPAEDVSCVRCLSKLPNRDAGTVTTVGHDDTGDTLAEWRGCIVGARFTRRDDALAFLAGDRSMEDRPARCTLPSGGYGGCVRQAEHPGQCADAHGYRFTLPTLAEKIATACTDAGIPVASDGLPVVGHPVWATIASNGAGTLAGITVWVRRERARSMAAHPAGKGYARARLAARGRFLPTTGEAYRAGMPAAPGVVLPLPGVAMVGGLPVRRPY